MNQVIVKIGYAGFLQLLMKYFIPVLQRIDESRMQLSCQRVGFPGIAIH